MPALVAGCILVAASFAIVPATTASASPTCTPDVTLNSGGDLSAAVLAYDCVFLNAGTYELAKQLTVPAGHDIFGLGTTREDVVIKPADAYDDTNSSILLYRNDNVSGTTDAVISHIENLAFDGTWNKSTGTTYLHELVMGGGFDLDNVVLRNTLCYGLGVTQYHTSITNSLLEYHGRGCPGGVPVGAGIYAIDNVADGAVAYWAPYIDHNEFRYTFGPAVDSSGVRSGVFTYNTVHYNTGYAGFALFGSGYWTVEHNGISQPSTEPGYQYTNGHCADTPYNVDHASGIFLCQRDATDDHTTTHNTIRYNTVSSYYGIMLVGNDETTAYWAPRENTLTSNTTTGSNIGCVDDFKGYPAFNPGQWYTDTNHWSLNTCQTSPSYIVYF
jgi:hypothetical protein